MEQELKAAIENGDAAAIERLLAGDPELSHCRDGETSGVMLAAYHRQEAIARALLAARGPADLFEAAALGLHDRVRALVGWDPRRIAARSTDGFTALHLAAFFGHADTVRALLAAGSYVEAIAENPTRVRPLHSAVASGSFEVVDALLSAGADREARQEGGFTPLMGAAAGGSEEMVRRLLDAGADPKARADNGHDALATARERGHAHLEALLGV